VKRSLAHFRRVTERHDSSNQIPGQELDSI
jgi:hypothetical protein